MKVYIIRYQSTIDGVSECGNFDYAYTDERKAAKAMLEDMKNIYSVCKKENKTGKVKKRIDKGDSGIADYCLILDGESDLYEWWIDVAPVVED